MLERTHVHNSVKRFAPCACQCEVAFDCTHKGTKLVRYKHVDVVRISGARLEAFRAFNKSKCDGEELMPKYSATMYPATLTKTHFVTGCKLVQDGNRTLANAGKVPFVFWNDDEEGATILSRGVVCCIYKEELLDDMDALEALVGADNENADTEMGEDEVQALGRVDTAISKVRQTGVAAVVDLPAVFQMMKKQGLGTFTDCELG